MIIIPKMNNIKTGLKLAKTGIKDAVHDENGVIGDTKRLISDVKEVLEQGKVYTSGVANPEAKAQIDSVADGLSAYAKANKLNIIFHTPMEHEHGFDGAQKTLGVSAYSSGLFNSYTDMALINGDVNAVTQFKGEKLNTEDTFLRRVFRTVEQLTKNINQERKADYDNSFIGTVTNGVKADAKNLIEKTKKGIKNYIDDKIKFVKEEFMGEGGEC